MKKWPYTVQSHSRYAIQVVTKDTNWQTFRETLVKMPTEEKLDHLYRRLNAHSDIMDDDQNPGIQGMRFDHEEKMRVDNYLNALKRGGQLNNLYQVVK